MTAAAFISELVARIRLSQGSSTLLMLVVPDNESETEQDLAGVTQTLSLLLEHDAVSTRVLSAGREAGPLGWTQAMQGQAVDASVVVLEPVGKLAGKMVAQQLNAQRQQLRELSGPLLVLVSRKTENLIQKEAPDFYTWRAATYVVPSRKELEALMREQGVRKPSSLSPERNAPTAPPLRFLHLSDLHLRSGDSNEYDQGRVLRGLIRYLEGERERATLDLIFMTGDLAYSGKASDYVLVTDFLQQLLGATGVKKEHVFAVPGNHDVDRSTGRWLRRTLESDKDSTEFFVDEANRRWHAEKFSAFHEAMVGALGPGHGFGLNCGAKAVEEVELRGYKLAVASFNSAWFAQDEEDSSKLWLGEANVDRAGERIQKADSAVAFALMHHPIEYLSEIEREGVETYLERTFDVVLRGHLHAVKARSMYTARGGYLEVAAPAAYQGSRWRNGCFLGSLDVESRSLELTPLQFGSGADPWVVNTKVFPDDAERGYRHVFELRRKRQARGMSEFLEPEVKRLYTQLSPGERAAVQRDLGIQAKSAVTADEEVLLKLKHPANQVNFGRSLSRHAHSVINVENLPRLARLLSQEVPMPVGPVSADEDGWFERLLSGFLGFWHSQGATWLETLNPQGELASTLILGAYLCRATTEGVEFESRGPKGRSADILLGVNQAEPQRRAIIEVKRGAHAHMVEEKEVLKAEILRQEFKTAHAAVVLFETSGIAAGSQRGKLDRTHVTSSGEPVLVLKL